MVNPNVLHTDTPIALPQVGVKRIGQWFTVITGHRMAVLEVVSVATMRSRGGKVVVLRRVKDAGAATRPGFAELRFTLGRRGDMVTLLESVLLERL